jgi:succinate dehydrogenase hydrophobic anchor subunit
MTKPQKAPHADWKVVPSKQPTYTTFYLILLILLTLSTVIGLFQLGSIDTAIKSLHTQPVLGSITLMQYVVTVVMGIGLIFLYKKQRRGLYLALSGYGAAVILSILFLFFKDPLVEDITRQVVTSGNKEVSTELARQVASTTLTVVPILNAISNILFGTLWYFAWQKQQTADSKKISN